MTYSAKMKGYKEHQAHYKKIERKMQGKAGDPLLQAVHQGALEVQRVAQTKYLTGPRPHRLGVISGRLRGDIKGRAKRHGNRVVGITGTNVSYGAIHELRGVGKAKKKRPFLRPALNDSRKFILKKIDRAFKEVYKK